MRLDHAEPVRDLLVLYGSIFGMQLAIAFILALGALCDSLWAYIIRPTVNTSGERSSL